MALSSAKQQPDSPADFDTAPVTKTSARVSIKDAVACLGGSSNTLPGRAARLRKYKEN